MLISDICYLKFSITAFFRERGVQVFLYLYLATRNHKYSPTTILPTPSPRPPSPPLIASHRFRQSHRPRPPLTPLPGLSAPPTSSCRNQPNLRPMKTFKRQPHLLHKLPHRIPTLHPRNPLANLASTYPISLLASCCAGQWRGPPLNGTKSQMGRSVAQRSGRKRSASGWKRSVRRCSA